VSDTDLFKIMYEIVELIYLRYQKNYMQAIIFRILAFLSSI